MSGHQNKAQFALPERLSWPVVLFRIDVVQIQDRGDMCACGDTDYTCSWDVLHPRYQVTSQHEVTCSAMFNLSLIIGVIDRKSFGLKRTILGSRNPNNFTPFSMD